MARLEDLASSILAEVDRELSKTAELTYTNNRAPVTTEIGQLMQKLAEAVRNDQSEITYSDLNEFRKHYNV